MTWGTSNVDRFATDEALAPLQRLSAVAVQIGMLTVGCHEPSPRGAHTPPAVVRIRTTDPAAEAWRTART